MKRQLIASLLAISLFSTVSNLAHAQIHVIKSFPPIHHLESNLKANNKANIEFVSRLESATTRRDSAIQNTLDSLMYYAKLIKLQQDSLSKSEVAKDSLGKFELSEVEIYGGGSLYSLAQGKETENNLFSGSLGLNFTTRVIACNVFYSFNDKDSVNISSLADLGSALMTTNRKGQSLNLDILFRPYFGTKHDILDNFGLRLRTSFSDQVWNTDSAKGIDASPITSSFSLVYVPFEVEQKDKIFRTTVEIGATFRAIKGDYNNESHIIESTTINPRGFNSIDLTLSQNLNNLQFYVNTSLSGRNNSKDPDKKLIIPGYTGTQVVFGLNVSGGITTLYERNKK